MREAVARYEAKLGANCYAMDRAEEDAIVLTLKGEGKKIGCEFTFEITILVMFNSPEEHRLR